MPRNDWVQVLAAVLLVCCTFVFFVDLGSEFQLRIAIKLKWGMAWLTARYTGIVIGILLAVDVLFYKAI